MFEALATPFFALVDFALDAPRAAAGTVTVVALALALLLLA